MTCRHRTDRRGVLLLCTLGVIVLVMMMSAAWVKQLTVERRHARLHPLRAQAECLVSAGFSRAVAKLSADRSYEGETWSIPAEALPTGQPADVTIRIEPGTSPGGKLVSIVVQSPPGPVPQVVRAAKLPIPLTSQESSP